MRSSVELLLRIGPRRAKRTGGLQLIDETSAARKRQRSGVTVSTPRRDRLAPSVGYRVDEGGRQGRPIAREPLDEVRPDGVRRVVEDRLAVGRTDQPIT